MVALKEAGERESPLRLKSNFIFPQKKLSFEGKENFLSEAHTFSNFEEALKYCSMCVSVFLMFNVFKANLIRIPMKISVNIHSLVLSCSICRGQPGLMEMTLSGGRGAVFVG